MRRYVSEIVSWGYADGAQELSFETVLRHQTLVFSASLAWRVGSAPGAAALDTPSLRCWKLTWPQA